MKHDTDAPVRLESAIKQLLRAEIDFGIDTTADPINANRPKLAIFVTTVNSPWYRETCRVCLFKFRENDRVRLCPECGQAYHDDNQYNLHCWQKKFANKQACNSGEFDHRFEEKEIPPCQFSWSGELPKEQKTKDFLYDDSDSRLSLSATLITQFVEGIETVWHPFGKQKIEKALPGSIPERRICPWCRFEVRVGDWVVRCPCDCGTYFHQDIFRHLTCWNEWNGVMGNDYCPNTSRTYKLEGDNENE